MYIHIFIYMACTLYRVYIVTLTLSFSTAAAIPPAISQITNKARTNAY